MGAYQVLISNSEQQIELNGKGHLKLLSCHTTNLPCGWQVRSHEHSYWELSFMISGEMTSYCDEINVPCRENICELFLVPSGNIHRRVFGPQEKNCNLSYIFILSDSEFANYFEAVCLQHGYHFEISGFTGQLIQEIRREYLCQHLSSATVLPLLAKLFLVEFLQGYIKNPVKVERRPLHWHNLAPQEKAVDIYEFLLSNMESKNLPEFACRSFNLSLRQLNRIYAGKWGISIAQAITHIRLEQSQLLISNTDMNIQEIASQLGFYSRAGFYLFFRKAFGMSPLEYRRQKNLD